MDTTIRNLDEEAYRRIKSRAALEGRTLGEAVSEAIRRYVETQAAGRPKAAEPAERRRPAGEVAETAEQGAEYGQRSTAEAQRAVLPIAPPTLAGLLERLAELGRPDPGFADDLEAIQAAQPRIGPGAWDS